MITIICNNNCDDGDDDDDETDYDADNFKNQKYFLWRQWWWVNLSTRFLEKDQTVIVIGIWSPTMPDNDDHEKLVDLNDVNNFRWWSLLIGLLVNDDVDTFIIIWSPRKTYDLN